MQGEIGVKHFLNAELSEIFGNPTGQYSPLKVHFLVD
jgi:hypothetical protein